MATSGVGVGSKPCGPVVKFISSTVGGALMLLLRFEVGSLLTPFAKGALVIVASVAECGICSSLFALVLAVLRVWTVTGADGALLKLGLYCVAVGRPEGALCFWRSGRVPSSAGISSEGWDLCFLLGDLLKELDALNKKPPGPVTSFWPCPEPAEAFLSISTHTPASCVVGSRGKLRRSRVPASYPCRRCNRGFLA
jgi:hypothetical protein